MRSSAQVMGILHPPGKDTIIHANHQLIMFHYRKVGCRNSIRKTGFFYSTISFCYQVEKEDC
jgi:hypothetical protein